MINNENQNNITLKLKDYYKILRLERTATHSEIKDAYKKLARIYHPDLHNGDKHISDKFAEITEAYNHLSDLDKRLRYTILLNRSRKLLDEVSFNDFSYKKLGYVL